MTIKATELLKLFTKADKLKLSVYVRESKDGDFEITIFKMYTNLFNYKVIITQNGESNWNKGDYSFDTMMNVLDEMLKEKEQEKIKEEKRQELISPKNNVLELNNNIEILKQLFQSLTREQLELLGVL